MTLYFFGVRVAPLALPALACGAATWMLSRSPLARLLYWTGLGVLSSVGLGAGLHTFLLFVLPHLLRITAFAAECARFDPQLDPLVCITPGKLSLLKTYLLVVGDVLCWGLGTALGELPPYFLARHAGGPAAKQEIEALLKQTASSRSLVQNVQVYLYQLVTRFGFWGVLLAASIPNPLFDIAGMVSGHFHVPFIIFFSATAIGKALIKCHVQAIAAMLVYSDPNLFPDWARAFIMPFQSKESFFGTIWNIVLATMVGYFAISIVDNIGSQALLEYQASIAAKAESERVKSDVANTAESNNDQIQQLAAVDRDSMRRRKNDTI